MYQTWKKFIEYSKDYLKYSTCIVFVSPSLQDIHQPFWDRWANVEAVPLDNMLNISEISRDLRFDKKECS